MTVHVCATPTDQPNDIEGGVGKDGGIVGLVQVVVGPLLAPDGLSGQARGNKERMDEGMEEVLSCNLCSNGWISQKDGKRGAKMGSEGR